MSEFSPQRRGRRAARRRNRRPICRALDFQVLEPRELLSRSPPSPVASIILADPPDAPLVVAAASAPEAPVFAALPIPITVRAGAPLELPLDVAFPDGSLSDLDFALVGSDVPLGAELVDDLLVPGRTHLRWTPPGDLSPQWKTFDVEAHDRNAPDLSGRLRILVYVWSAPQVDVLEVEAASTQHVVAGRLLESTVVALDPDQPDADLLFGLGPGAPAGASIDRTDGRLAWRPSDAQVGRHVIDIVVQNRDATERIGAAQWIVDVSAANAAPVWSGPLEAVTNEDAPIQFTGPSKLSLSDADASPDPTRTLTIVSLHGTFRWGDAAPVAPLPGIVPSGAALSAPLRRASVEGSLAQLNAALDGLLFAPDPDFGGVAQLRLEASDGGQGRASDAPQPAAPVVHTVTIDVAHVDEAPQVADQALWLLVDGSEGGAQRLVARNPDAHRGLIWRLVAGNADSAVALDPFSGAIWLADKSLAPGTVLVLQVEASYMSGAPLPRQAQLTLTVAPGDNLAPILYDKQVDVEEDKTVGGNLLDGDGLGASDYDPNDDALTLVEVQDSAGELVPFGEPTPLPSGATLTIEANGSFSYDASTSLKFDALFDPLVPASDWFSYTASDRYGASGVAQVDVAIAPINDRHVVAPQNFILQADAASGMVVGRVRVAHAEPNEPLAYRFVAGGNPGNRFQLNAQGELRWNSPVSPTLGAEYALQIAVDDTEGVARSAPVRVKVVDDRGPIADDPVYVTAEDAVLRGNLLADDWGWGAPHDPDGDALVVAAIDGASLRDGVWLELGSGARAQFFADGEFTYDPTTSRRFDALAGGAMGVERVAITLRDAWSQETTLQAQFSILGRNDPIVAVDQRIEAPAGAAIRGNLLADREALDADDQTLRIVRAAGVEIPADADVPTEIALADGATLSITSDGAYLFRAGAASVGFFAYESTDGELASTGGVATRVTPPLPRADAPLHIDDFGLALDAGSIEDGPIEGARRTLVPLLMGDLAGSIVEDPVEADHFLVEIDLDAQNPQFDIEPDRPFESDPRADPRDVLALWPTDASFPHFEFDPRLPLDGNAVSGVFDPTPGVKRIAYRAIAVDAEGVPLRRTLAQIDDDPAAPPRTLTSVVASAWRFFEFEWIEPDDQGVLRAADVHLLHEATTVQDADRFLQGLDGNVTLQVAGGVHDALVAYDPRLEFSLLGDFSERRARLEVTHTYYNRATSRDESYVGVAGASALGALVYDPRQVDAALADLSEPLEIVVGYRLYAVDPLGIDPEVLVADRPQAIAFLYAPPLVSDVATSISETPRDVAPWWSAMRQIDVFVSLGESFLADASSLRVEFQFADANEPFDDPGRVDDAVPLPIDPTDATFLTPQKLTYEVWEADKVRARTVQWDAELALDRVGHWSNPLSLGALRGPSIRELQVTSERVGDRAFPLVVGEVALPEAHADLTPIPVGLFFRAQAQPQPLEAQTPDVQLWADASGGFQYRLDRMPADWTSYGHGYVFARTLATPLGATSPLASDFRSVANLVWADPLFQLPDLAPGTPALARPDQAEPPAFENGWRWQTRSREIVGSLVKPNDLALDFANVRVELAFDTPGNEPAQPTAVVRPDAAGEFSLLLPPLDQLGSDSTTIRARVTYLDPYRNVQTTGAWSSLALRLLPEVNLPSQVVALEAVHPIAQLGALPVAQRPEVAGRVVNSDGYVGFVAVEVRNVATNQLLGAATTDAEGNFIAALDDAAPGPIEIAARAADWDFAVGAETWGPWSTGEQTLHLFLTIEAPPPVVFFGVSEDDVRDDDDVDDAASTRVLAGALAEPATDVRIELDWADADGVFDEDGMVVDDTILSDAQGRFAYAVPVATPDVFRVRARSAAWDPSLADWVVTPWYVLGHDAQAPSTEEVNAADAYRAAEANAATSYDAAIAGALAQYQQALDDRTPADRATYDLNGYFTWPTAPDPQRLDIPSDDAQPSRPAPLPTFDGPAFTWDRDPLYQDDLYDAEEQFRNDVAEAWDAFQAALDAPGGPEAQWRDDMAAASAAYRQAVDAARSAFDASRAPQANPPVDQQAVDDLNAQVADAWAAYRAAFRDADQSRRETLANALAQRNAAWAEASLSEAQAKEQALENAFDDDCEHPDTGSQIDDSDFWCSGDADHPQDGFEYEKEGDYDSSQLHSPPEALALAKALYQIDRRYAPDYAEMLDAYAEAAAQAETDFATTVASALHQALETVYAAEHALADLTRAHAQAQLADLLNDQYALTVALAHAGAAFAAEQADADAQRGKARADLTSERQAQIALAQRTQLNSQAAAQRDAVVRWHAARQTPWTAYAALRAQHQYAWQLSEASAGQARDVAHATAERNEAYAQADAHRLRTIADADALAQRTIDEADAVRAFRRQAADARAVRDAQLTAAWHARRSEFAAALAAYRKDLAAGNGALDVEFAHAAHAYGTATPGGAAAGFSPLYYGYWLQPETSSHGATYALNGLVGGESPYDGWAYDISIAWWFGEVRDEVDNADERLRLDRQWHEAVARIRRDRDLLAADVGEQFGETRIDASARYRETTARAAHDAATTLASARADFEIDVAHAAHDYALDVVVASAAQAHALALADAARRSADAGAEGAYRRVQAGAARTLAIEDSEALVDFADDAMSAYVAAIANAPRLAGPWRARQLAEALAAADLVAAEQAAEQAVVVARSNQHVTWTNATTNAEQAYAVAVGAAAVARADAIGDAETAAVAAAPLVAYVTLRAASVAQHDGDLADADLRWIQNQIEADTSRDAQVNHAAFDYARNAAQARFQYERPAGGDWEAYQRKLHNAELKAYVVTVEANKSRANDLAAARSVWTSTVSDVNVALVTAFADAEQTEARRKKSAQTAATTSIAHAQKSYRVAVSSATKTLAVADAEANYAEESAGVSSDRAYAAAMANARDAHASAYDGALHHYRLALLQNHAVQAAAQFGPSSYQATAANVDVAWTLLASPIDVARQDARRAANFAQTLALADVEATAAIAASQAASQAAVSQATVEHTLRAALANGDATLAIAEATASGALLEETTRTLAEQDVDAAMAVRRRNVALADAGVDWVASVAGATADYNIAVAKIGGQLSTGEIDRAQFDELSAQIYGRFFAAKNAADARRSSARMHIEEAFQAALHGAAKTREADRRDAQLDYVHAIAEARRTHAVRTAADVAWRQADTAQLEATRQVQDLVVERDAAQASAEAVHLASVASADADVAWRQARWQPDVVRAGNLAQAEADAVRHAVQVVAAQLTQQHYADPLNGQLAFDAAAAEAHAAWVTILSTAPQPGAASPFAAHRASLAHSAAQQSLDHATRDRRDAVATSRAETDAAQGLVAQTSVRDVALAQADARYRVAQAAADQTLATSIADADAAFEVAHAESLDRLDAGADAAAATRTWQRRIASAEQRHAQTYAGLERARTAHYSAAQQAFAEQAAQLTQTRDLATSVLQHVDLVERVALDNAAAAREAVAQADLLSAHHAAQIDGYNTLVVYLDTPWTRAVQALANAEQAIWQATRSSWLAREEERHAAQLAYARTEAQLAAEAAAGRAAIDDAYQRSLAAAVADQATSAADRRRDGALAVARNTHDYRTQSAELDYRESLARQAAAQRNELFDSQPFADRADQIADDWQAQQTRIEAVWRVGLAREAAQFVAATGALYQQRAADLVAVQQVFDAAAATARYDGPVHASLELRLAAADYAYETTASQLRAVDLTQAAVAHPSPWTLLAAAQAAARRDQVDLPLAALARDQRVGAPDGNGQAALAAQARVAQQEASLAGRQRSLAEAVDVAAAQQALASAAIAEAASWTPTEAATLPVQATPPSVALPYATPIGSTSALANAGLIDDSYYDSLPTNWRNGWFLAGSYYWSGDYHSFLPWYDGYGAASSMWAGAGELGAVGYGDPLQGIWHYGWAGWSPRYSGIPPAPSAAGTSIDPQESVAAYEDSVAALVGAARAAFAALAPSELKTAVAIATRTGEVAIGIGAWGVEYFASSIDDAASRYGVLAPVVRRHVDVMGGGAWQGRRVREVLEALDGNGADFLVPNLRLRLTDDGSPTPTYTVYGADKQRIAYHDATASRVFGEILRGERNFVLEAAIPAKMNDVEAANYLLGLIVADAPQGVGASPSQIARLYRAFLTREQRGEALFSNTQRLHRLAARHGSDYARFYLETIGGASTIGSVGLAAYKVDQESLAAGALELVFLLPIGAIWKLGTSRIGVQVTDNVVAAIPVQAIELVQAGRGIGIDELHSGLRAASGAIDAHAAKEAIDLFLRRNGLLKLATHGRTARKLMRDALTSAEGHGATHLMFANPNNLPVGRAAHHIVPVQFFNDPLIGGRLHALGIDLNGVDNGVWLPTQGGEGIVAAIHGANHTARVPLVDGSLQESYADVVLRQLEEVLSESPTRESILRLINTIRNELLNGDLRLFADYLK